MSSTTPTPPGEPEYLEIGGPEPRKPRRGLVVAIVAGVVVALGLPLGAFAMFRLFGGGGTQPHDVLPADAVAYFRVDLDPSAPEKIDAIRFLRTFPAFEKYTRIDDDRVDVREVIFDAVTESAPCELDFQADVEPWLGERFGVAVMAAGGIGAEPDVAVAVQVTDETAAREGLQGLRSCEPAASGQGGWVYQDGYMIVAASEQQAKAFAADATRRPLGEDAQFRSDMERLGDQGVASLWVSGEGLYQALGSTAGGQLGLLGDELKRSVEESYRSVAVAFRFDDSYAELATVATGSGYQEPTGEAVADMALPQSTAVAFGFAGGTEYVDRQWDTLLDMADAEAGMDAAAGPDQTVREVERAFGLRLPADLQTLVGESFTLALDGSKLDIDTLVSSGNLSALDLGARVRTDAGEFERVVGTLETQARRYGVPLDLVVEHTGDGAVVALNDGYAAALAQGGPLDDTAVFTTAVPNAEEAQGVLFVNFDALEQEIVDAIRKDGGDVEAIENLTKIEAFGVSTTVHDGYATGTLRLTVGE